MEVERGAGRRLGAVASAGFLRSPWAAAAAVVGKARGGSLSLGSMDLRRERER
jgi:hypothetical protein